MPVLSLLLQRSKACCQHRCDGAVAAALPLLLLLLLLLLLSAAQQTCLQRLLPQPQPLARMQHGCKGLLQILLVTLVMLMTCRLWKRSEFGAARGQQQCWAWQPTPHQVQQRQQRQR
jgi:hypothetical protein